MLRDCAATTTIAIAAGGPAAGAGVCALLEKARLARGTLPLVWQTDNGPAYVSATVRDYLERNHVIHLRSRPRTPTDNPTSEHGIGELKAEAGECTYAAAAVERLERARRVLDEGRLRATRGWRTAAQLDASLPRAGTLVDRDRFYAEACSTAREALLGARDARVARRLEREAILALLERYGLARRRIGPQRLPGPREPSVLDARMAP